MGKVNRFLKLFMVIVIVCSTISPLTAMASNNVTKAEPKTKLPIVYDQFRNFENNEETIIIKTFEAFVQAEPDTTYYYMFGADADMVEVYYDGEDGEPIGSYFEGPLVPGELVTTIGQELNKEAGIFVNPDDNWKITIPTPKVGEPVVLRVIAYKNDVASEIYTHTFIVKEFVFWANIVDNKFSISVLNNADKDVKGTMLLAIYKKNGPLVMTEKQNFTASEGKWVSYKSGFNADEYDPEQYTYKVFCWDENYVPLASYIEIKIN